MGKIYKNKQAFTLVELIVVITILAILSTIGFLSYQGYGINSRDAVRMSDIRNMITGLNLERTKGNKLPLPEDSIQITASGTLLTYQGYAGTGTLGKIRVNGGGRDPLTNKFYTYSRDTTGNKYQLLGYFEKNPQVYFFDTTYAQIQGMYPKVYGEELGIVLDANTGEPVQDSNVDILNTVDNYEFIINNNVSGKFDGSGEDIIDKWVSGSNLKSCAEIFQMFPDEFLKEDIYTITSSAGEKIKVFCDMKNGGFTGLFSVNPSGTTWRFDSNEWINPTVKENDFLTQETTLRSYSDFNTNEIKICRGDLNNCYIINHGLNIPLQRFYSEDITYIDFSRHKYREDLPETHYANINPPETIGPDNQELFFDQLLVNDPENNNYRFNKFRHNKYGLGINLHNTNKLGFQGDNSWPGSNNYGLGIGVFMPYHEGSTLCIPGNPIDSSRALSVLISGVPCFYDNPDDKMWYVLGK